MLGDFSFAPNEFSFRRGPRRRPTGTQQPWQCRRGLRWAAWGQSPVGEAPDGSEDRSERLPSNTRRWLDSLRTLIPFGYPKGNAAPDPAMGASGCTTGPLLDACGFLDAWVFWIDKMLSMRHERCGWRCRGPRRGSACRCG